MIRSVTIIAAACIAVASASSARSGTADAKLRIERLAIWTGAGAACTRFGYIMPEEKADAAERAMLDEANRAGIPEAEAKRLYAAGMERQIKLFSSESQSLIAAIEEGGRVRPKFEAMLLRWDAMCQEAASDPDFGQWLTGGTDAERAIARRDMLDGLLEKLGEASWQTPKIVGRGDLLFAIGACQRHLTQAQTKQLQAGLLDGPAPTDEVGAKVRAYYEMNLTGGIENAASLDFDATQCGRLITRRKAEAK